MKSNVSVIAWREFKAIVLTKSYLASILLVPLVVVFTVIVAFSLQFINIASKPALKVAIVDHTDKLAEFALKNKINFPLQIYSKTKPSTHSKISWHTVDSLQADLLSLEEKIKTDKLNGLVTLPKNFFEDSKLTFLSRNNLTGTLPVKLNSLFQEFRLQHLRQKSQIKPEELDKILQPIQVEAKSLIEKNKANRESSSLKLLAAAAIYGILSICIAIHGSKLTMSILEEKKSKIVEILLSAVKPIEFMWGKIIGSGAAAILQTGIWSTMMFIIFMRSGALVFETTAKAVIKNGYSGAALDPVAGTELVQTAIQENVSINALDNPQISFNPEMLFYLIIFTITGFLLYATLFAAVGAIANSVTEAQYLETPLVFLMMFPTYLFLPLIENPNGPVIVGSSFFPYFSPFVMYSRICVDQVPHWQIFLSLALVVLAILVNVYIVSGLYRAGLLLYGKKITFKEIFGLFKIKNF